MQILAAEGPLKSSNSVRRLRPHGMRWGLRMTNILHITQEKLVRTESKPYGDSTFHEIPFTVDAALGKASRASVQAKNELIRRLAHAYDKHARAWISAHGCCPPAVLPHFVNGVEFSSDTQGVLVIENYTSRGD